jgi:hypothetical protein
MRIRSMTGIMITSVKPPERSTRVTIPLPPHSRPSALKVRTTTPNVGQASLEALQREPKTAGAYLPNAQGNQHS